MYSDVNLKSSRPPLKRTNSKNKSYIVTTFFRPKKLVNLNNFSDSRNVGMYAADFHED